MKVGATTKITLQFDDSITTNLNTAVRLVVYLIVNGKVYLRYIQGGDPGYDGDITIDGNNDNICYIHVTRAKSLTLVPGRMSAEAMLVTADINYNPEGKFTIVNPEIIEVEPSYTTEE